MADDVTLTSAKTPAEWVQAFYGDDAFDYKKVEKLRHIKHTGQFASFCYVISKNTKQAHTDFFTDNYTTVDKMYARAAELILKLLYVKFNEERNLTRADFDACGGTELFGGRPNYDQIVSDYIGAGGMVDMCQTLIPISTDNAKTAKNIKEINDDMDNVKKDHTRLLSITNSTEGTLSRDQIFSMFHASSDCASKAWKMHKKNKTKGELELQKDMEDAYMYRYDLAKKSGKMAILAGTTVASIGAIVGGVFWPALLLLPIHSLSKKWIPDWFKSMGQMWGNLEKRFKSKRAIDRAAAFQNYIVAYAEAKKNGTRLKMPWKYRRLVRKADMTLLNKQAKQVMEGLTLEGTDGKVHKSSMDVALDAISGSRAFGTLLNNKDGDGLVPADAADVLGKRLGAINILEDAAIEPSLLKGKTVDELADHLKGAPQFKDFIDIARTYKGWKGSLSTDAQFTFENSYSEKLLDSAEQLIFCTPMESLTDYKDKVAKHFKDDSLILEPVKDTRPDVLETIKRYVTFASKELTGLEGSWKGRTLKEYIYRDPEATLTDANFAEEYSYFDKTTIPPTSGRKYLNMTDPSVVAALNCIKNLQVSSKDNREVVYIDTSVSPHVEYKLPKIQSIISSIADNNDKSRVDELLQQQMNLVFRNDSRKDSRASYEAIMEGNFTGKNEFSDVFEKIKDMTYENVGSSVYSTLRTELTTKTKINPPEMGRYLCGKISKMAYDVFNFYASEDDNKSKFTTDLPFLIEYLRKLNNSSLLNEQQKMALTANVKQFIAGAVDKYAKNISTVFMDAESGYKHREIEKFLNESYADGGLKLLFQTDKSPETIEVENKLASLSRLSTLHTNLKFNGYTMTATDQRILGMVLLRDGNDGFETVKTRKGNDKLVDFLTNKLNCSDDYPEFSSISDESQVTAFVQGANTPFKNLEDKLKGFLEIDGSGNIMLNTDGTYKMSATGTVGNDFFDRYAALVALKNKTIIEFRQFISQMAYAKCSTGDVNHWMANEGKPYVQKAIDAWNSLFEKIDLAINSNRLQTENSLSGPALEAFKARCATLGITKPLKDEYDRFKTGYKLSLVTEKSLGG